MPQHEASAAPAGDRFLAADPASGALNARGLCDQLETALALARRTSGVVALVRIDVEAIAAGAVHDAAAADALAAAVSQRLRACVRDHDLIARVGPAAFAVVLQALDAVHPADVAVRLVAELRRPFHVAGRPVRCDACAGVAAYPADAEAVLELWAAADAALARGGRTETGCTAHTDATRASNG